VKVRVALLLGLVAVVAAVVPGAASAANPVINNTATGCNTGQDSWLVSCAVAGEDSSKDSGDPGTANQVRVTALITGDVANTISSLLTNEQWNGNTTTRAPTCDTKPATPSGYPRSRCDLRWTYTSHSGTGLNPCGTLRTASKILGVQARDSANQTSAQQTSIVRFTTASHHTGCTESPYLYSWDGAGPGFTCPSSPTITTGATNFAQSTTPGTSLRYCYTGDSPGSGEDFDGVNWRWRNLRTGTIAATGSSCPANGDNAVKGLTVNAPERGLWVLEAELKDTNGGTNCANNRAPGYWFPLGTADVNSSSIPAPALAATRPNLNASTTITLTPPTDPDSGADDPGGAQILQWDLDENTTNGTSGFEADQIAGIGATFSTNQIKTINTTGMSPGLHTVRARVLDNGAMDAADATRRTSSITSVQYRVDAPPVLTAPASVTSEYATQTPIALSATDGDGDTLTYSVSSGPSHGTGSFTSTTGASTTYNYTPAANYAGADSVTFQVSDGFSGTASKTVPISVEPDTNIDSAPTSPAKPSNSTFTFSSHVAGATFQCRVDSGAFSSCTSPFTPASLSDGTHTFQVRSTVSAITDSSPASATWLVDSTPPDTQIDAPTPSSPTNSTTATFKFHADDPGATFECRLDNAVTGFTSCTSPTSYPGLAAGSHTFEVRGKDTAGNVDASPASYTWTIDTAPPNTTITGSPNDPTKLTNATFTYTSTETVTRFECSLDDAAFTTCPGNTLSGSITYNGPLGNGLHNFRVQAVDLAGNTDPTPDSFSWNIDTVAPDTVIDTKPPALTNQTSATFTFHSTEPTNATFECKLDTGSFTACNSGTQTYSSLSAAQHTFQVRATDAAGNTDPSPDSWTWTVDTAAPDTVIDTKPPALTNQTSATFTFHSTEPTGATFECKLDTGSFTACNSGTQTYSSLSAAQHTFQVRATDAAGNTDQSPDSWTWTIDTTKPTVELLTHPNDPTNVNSASFGFQADESVTGFECQLDGLGYSGCTSPQTYGSLGDGSHTFNVRATDTAGNLGDPTTFTWLVDTSPPNTLIDTHPNQPFSNSAMASFTYHSTEPTGATFECKLDTGAFTPCNTQPQAYSGLSQGSHTFQVRATDAAGNQDASADSFTWTIDTAAPETTINANSAQYPAPGSGNANHRTGNTSADFDFSSNETGSRFQCRLDSSLESAFQACSVPAQYTGLSDGPHKFEVRAIDQADNADQSPASWEWSVYQGLPDTILDTYPDNPSNSSDATFTFHSGDPPPDKTFRCRLDSAALAPCTSPWTYHDLTGGPHTFEVVATDEFGRDDPSSAVYSWTVDLSNPVTTIDDHPLNPSNSAAANFTFHSSDPGSSFDCSLDGSAFADCNGASSQSYTGLGDGSHTFRVQATDPAGNNEQTPQSFTWLIDTHKPQTTIDQKPANPSNINNPSFQFSSDEANSTFECRLDNALAGFTPCSTNLQYTNLTEGSHTFEVRATDAAHNTDDTPASYTWIVDLSPPNTTITDSPPSLTNQTSASFQFTSELNAGFECRLDSSLESAFHSCSSGDSFTVGAGQHTFEVRAVDQAGNRDPSPDSRTWTVDTTAPVTAITDSPTDPTNSGAAVFKFSSDAGSSFQCKLDTGAFAPCSSGTDFGPVGAGSHTFQVKATDPANNTGPAASYTWFVDTTNPSAQINDPKPADPTNSTAAVFNFSGTDNHTAAGALSFQCKLDTGAFAPCSSGSDFGPVGAGSHTFQVKATDEANNTGDPASYAWFVDRTKPTVQITDPKPGNPTNSTAAVFSFSGTDDHSAAADLSFQCKLDSGAFAPCSSGTDFGPVGAGSHTFQVKATDQAANTGDAASYTWFVDTTNPSVTIDDPKPASLTNDTAAVFSFSGTDDHSAAADLSFQCKLDTGAFAACTSGDSFGPVAPGSHTFQVKATDQASNTGPAASYTWFVDTTNPSAQINDPKPADPTNSTAAVFNFSGTDNHSDAAGLSFQCKLDTGAFAACNSGTDFGPVGAGSHTFQVKATDQAANTGDPASYTWFVDTTNPSAQINDPKPADPTNQTDAVFNFSGTDNHSAAGDLSFQCKLDSGAFAACSSGTDFGPVGAGSHTFQVKATDEAANTGDAASYSWFVDATKPTVTITDPKPADPTNSTDAVFDFSGDDNHSDEEDLDFQCQLDSGGFSPCSSGAEFGPALEGNHTFEVKATDEANNSSDTASYTWNVDTTNPTVAITDPKPADPTNLTTAVFNFSGDDNQSDEGDLAFECKLDTGAFAPCTSGTDFGPVTSGSHTFKVHATDQASNTGPDATYTWTVDTTAPNATITAKPADPSNSTAAVFAFGSDETGSTFQCKLDAGAFASCTSGDSFGPVTPGSHTFQVKATDQASNTGPAASYTWFVDQTNPSAQINDPKPADPTNSTAAVFNFSGTDNHSAAADLSFQCKLDTGAFAACTSGDSFGPVTPGSHTFEVKATDEADNTGDAASYTWFVDTTKPTVQITDPKPADPTNSTAAVFTFSGDDNHSDEEDMDFQCQLDNGGFNPCSSGDSFGPVSEDTHTFEVKVTDEANNTSDTASHTWTVDTTDPEVHITTGPGLTKDDTPSWDFTVSDNPTSVTCQVDSGAPVACTTPFTASTQSPGDHTLTVTATDAAANGGSDSKDFTVDTQAPDTTIVNPKPADPTNSTAAVLNFAGSDDHSGAAQLTFECQLDGGGFNACSSGHDFGPVGQGSHTFEVKATDQAGNTDQSPASYTWVVDTTAPTVNITTGPSGTTSQTGASFDFTTGGNPATIECKLDTGAVSACTTPKSYSTLGDGPHTFTVMVTDAATNIASASRTWTVDTGPPNTTIDVGPGATSSSSSAHLEFSSNETGGTFECRLDSTDAADFQPCSSPKDYSNLAIGQHTFDVRAIDAAANVDATPATRTWNVVQQQVLGEGAGSPVIKRRIRALNVPDEGAFQIATITCRARTCQVTKKEAKIKIGGQTYHPPVTVEVVAKESVDSLEKGEIAQVIVHFPNSVKSSLAQNHFGELTVKLAAQSSTGGSSSFKKIKLKAKFLKGLLG
jgi:hypothetical protein